MLTRSKFKAGVENVKSSLQSISAQELLSLLDSQDYVGAVSANDKYHGQVFSEEQMDLLLDRSDLAWEGNNTESNPGPASTGGIGNASSGRANLLPCTAYGRRISQPSPSGAKTSTSHVL